MLLKKFAASLPSRIIGMLSGGIDPTEARHLEKELASEVNRLLGAFVVAGVVGPEDVHGTQKKKNSDPQV